MSSIKLNELKKVSGGLNDYTYRDLHLDINQTERFIGSSKRSVKTKDIDASYDEAAIANSIFNILNTRQGQRFLIPTFGCNLLGYVGQPVSDSTGAQIGRTIYDAIRVWEPRVNIADIYVVGHPDTHEYDISIYVSIPSLKKTNIKLIGVLTSSGILESRIT